jgi:hypothetical protein
MRYLEVVAAVAVAISGAAIAGERPSEAVSIELDCPVDEARLGDVVPISIRYSNRSTQPVVLTVQQIVSLGLCGEQPLKLLISKKNGERIPHGTVSMSSIPPAVVSRIIEPKSEYTISFDLFDLVSCSIPSGEIVIQAVYRDKKYDLRAKPIKVEICEPTSEDKRILKIYDQHRYSVSIDESLGPVNALLEKYPKSYLRHRLLELKARLLFETRPEESFAIREQLVKSGKASYATRWRVFHVLEKQRRYREAIEVLSPVKEFGAKESIAVVRQKLMEQAASESATPNEEHTHKVPVPESESHPSSGVVVPLVNRKEDIDSSQQDSSNELIPESDSERESQWCEITGGLFVAAIIIVGVVVLVRYRRRSETDGKGQG